MIGVSSLGVGDIGLLVPGLLCLGPRTEVRLVEVLGRKDPGLLRCCGLACSTTGVLGILGSMLLAELLRFGLGLVGPKNGPCAAFMVCSL